MTFNAHSALLWYYRRWDILVNGKPTSSKVVWCSLVNVDHVKMAVQKLRKINWLYSEVYDDSVDEISA